MKTIPPRSRAAIVGLGGWGLEVIAHLWPRLDFQDRQRKELQRDLELPSLNELVTHTLVYPSRCGEIKIFQTRGDAHPEPYWLEKQIVPLSNTPLQACISDSEYRGERLLKDFEEDFLELRQELKPIREINTLFDPPRANRGEILRTFVEQEGLIDRYFSDSMRPARYDSRTKGSEAMGQMTVFIVCSLADELASVLVWPTARMFQAHFGESHIAQIVGILSTGAYSRGPYGRLEEATVCTSLREIELLERGPSVDTRIHDSFPSKTWRDHIGTPVFDRIYLLDEEKSNWMLSESLMECTLAAGNALEAFLTTTSLDWLNDSLSPDQADLQREAPYSTFGAVSTYLPINEMLLWSRDHLVADLVQNHFPATDDAQVRSWSEKESRAFLRDGLTINALLSKLADGVPLRVVNQPTYAYQGKRWWAFWREDDSPRLQHSDLPGVQVDWQQAMAERPREGNRNETPGTWRRRLLEDRQWLVENQIPQWIQTARERIGLQKPTDESMERQRAWLRQQPGRESLERPADLIAQFRERMIKALADEIVRHNHGLYNARALAQKWAMDLAAERNRIRTRPGVNDPAPRHYPRRFADWLSRFRRTILKRPYPGAVAIRVLALWLLPVFPIGAFVVRSTAYLSIIEWIELGLLLLGVWALPGIAILLWHEICMSLTKKQGVALTKEWVDFRITNGDPNSSSPGMLDLCGQLLDDLAITAEQLAEVLNAAIYQLEEFIKCDPEPHHLPGDVKSSYLREPRVDKDLWGWVLSQKHRPGLKDFESKQWAQHNPKGARQVRTALEFHLAVRQAMVEELKGMNPEKPTTDCETLARDRVRTLPMFRDVADADLNLWDILLTTVKSFVSSKLFPLPDDGRYTIENFVVGREELAASSPSELVRDLELRAKPFMFIEDSTLKDPPLQKDFLTVDQPSTSFFQGQSDDPDGLRVFASYDPFSIGCVRTVHGLSLEAMGSLRRYHRTFQRLDEFDRKQLMAMNVHCYEIEETEDRLPSVLSPCASTSRIA